MRRAAACLFACLALPPVTARAQERPAAPQPTFQSGVDLVQVDVSVLEKGRKPVRGLTAADFIVLEDGRARPVAAFTAVDLPPAAIAAPTGSWMRDVAADATANDITAEGRLVVIMLDRTIGEGASAINARRIAAAAIEQLSPNDVAAVVYTVNRANPQNFTRDRARLLQAIETPPHGTEESDDARAFFDSLGVAPVPSGSCYCGLCAPAAITQTADALAAVRQRRKILLFIGRGISINTPVPPFSGPDCDSRLKDARTAMFRATAIANLTVYTLDPSGVASLNIPAGLGIDGRNAPSAVQRNRTENQVRQDSLRVLADQTGGRAVINTNTPGEAVPAIFGESSSYYVLGFHSADQARDGRAHKIEVKVARRGVEVRARTGYIAPSTFAPDAAATGAPAPLTDAVTGVLPATALRLRVTAAPFASRERTTSAVLVSLNVEQQGTEGTDNGSEHVDIFTAAFDREGRSRQSLRQAIDVPHTGGPLRYDAIGRLDLPPGRYEIRVASAHREAGRLGSVYMDLQVPDFAKAPLSLSGVLLQDGTTAAATPDDVFRTLVPVTPTSRREFARGEPLTAFVRVYQGGRDPVERVDVRTQIANAAGAIVVDGVTTVEPDEFSTERAADYQLALPLERLAPGEYLLTIDATLGTSGKARRDVRFSVH